MLDPTSEMMSLIEIMHRLMFILKTIVNVKNHIAVGFSILFPSIFFLLFMVHTFLLAANYCARPRSMFVTLFCQMCLNAASIA